MFVSRSLRKMIGNCTEGFLLEDHEDCVQKFDVFGQVIELERVSQSSALAILQVYTHSTK